MLRLKEKDIAVAPIFDPPKTKGGLFIPEIAKERSDQGIVKYVGKDVEDVYYGDHVMFAAYDGTLAHLDREGLLIVLPYDKIVAIIHPPETRIDGIYFKSPLDEEEMEAVRAELRSILINSLGSGEKVIDEIIAAGFIKNVYFPASYEMTIELVAEAITNADWKDQFRFKDRKEASPSRSKVF
jgi:chaperonin GroES